MFGVWTMIAETERSSPIEYTIRMQRSPTLTDAEARARLCRVYEMILRRAADKETSAGESLGEPAAEAVESPARDADPS